jgi:hypothetical protein
MKKVLSIRMKERAISWRLVKYMLQSCDYGVAKVLLFVR